MKPKRTSAAETGLPQMRVTLLTMDHHLASAAARVEQLLRQQLPGLVLKVHTAAQWRAESDALQACREDIAQADLVVVSMLFMEDHFLPVLADLQARREQCDAMVCIMSAPEIMQLTRMGRYVAGQQSGGLMGLLKKLRPQSTKPAQGGSAPGASAGARQMTMLRRLPKLLRLIPGTAQDLRVFFLVMRYWLAGSEENLRRMMHLLVSRYAQGPRQALRQLARVEDPIEYPEVGIYHPRMKSRLSENLRELPTPRGLKDAPTVGLLMLRSYLLSGNTAHYDAVIDACEARGLRVIPAFASGLDARPAVEQFFMRDGQPKIDALLSLTGFSLVGGPAYNDAQAAEALLKKLDVPYVCAHPLEFQSIDQWALAQRGLLPVESTIMVAIPELDGATAPTVFAGRAGAAGTQCKGCAKGCTFAAQTQQHDMHPCFERIDTMTERVARWVAVRRKPHAERKLGIVLFNFPPQAGHVGTAAFLAVFESLQHTLMALAAQGYRVDVPASVDDLRERILNGNAKLHGTQANVLTRIAASDHVRRETWLKEIEAEWGPAPGSQLSNGRELFVLGIELGQVVVLLQPGFGYEGDPMRLLFERSCAPTHAFSAFYRYLKEDFAADAVLHFGTHGALEFMPGKQTGLSGECWPERLIGALPNVYLYAANNPSEGALAKRRSAATLVSYLTPSVTQAGLYKGLLELKQSIDRWRDPDLSAGERENLLELLATQAQGLDLSTPETETAGQVSAWVQSLSGQLLELEYALIPQGLHVLGRAPSATERVSTLKAMAQAMGIEHEGLIEAVVEQGADAVDALTPKSFDTAQRDSLRQLVQSNELLQQEHEIHGLLRALDGRYIAPAAGGDLLRNPQVLPTGRNLHGLDPFRMPSNFAVKDGGKQAQKLLDRCAADGLPLPETIAMVLWGTDNLKSEGGPMAQALALMGAMPRFDNYGRLAGAQLIPLAELGRPRIDVVITLSGIFRDLLPMQIKLLAEAALMAASADEDESQNYVRKHTLAYMREHGVELETAALRVFGNAEGAYGANVNHLVDSSCWEKEDELGDAFVQRKGFAYGVEGHPVRHQALMQSVLSTVALTYQNVDSVELGVTSIDTYFDTLGGFSRAVLQAKHHTQGAAATAPGVYIGDQTQGEGVVRTLGEQVALETRTRMLNPKWHESMLQHGFEGVRQIESHLTNTMGWSATTGQIQPWVYQQLAQTFILDPAMRERMAQLNPAASAQFAHRLLEASRRNFWQPDSQTLMALQQAGAELEDRLEGITEGQPA
jgi:magnesium chelatase subunit H